MSAARPATVIDLGRTEYTQVYAAMQRYTGERTEHSGDEIWLTEHEPVFTQGQAGRAEHVLAPGDIPVVPTDRGGQVTYHGPGQIVAYLLFDLRRLGISVRGLVTGIESAVVATLAAFEIEAQPRPDAPGVYVDGAKIGSLGLRVRRGCSYHGLSLNVDMDLEPFSRINPCGLTGLDVVQMTDYCSVDPARVRARLVEELSRAYDLEIRTADSRDFSAA